VPSSHPSFGLSVFSLSFWALTQEITTLENNSLTQVHRGNKFQGTGRDRPQRGSGGPASSRQAWFSLKPSIQLQGSGHDKRQNFKAFYVLVGIPVISGLASTHTAPQSEPDRCVLHLVSDNNIPDFPKAGPVRPARYSSRNSEFQKWRRVAITRPPSSRRSRSSRASSS